MEFNLTKWKLREKYFPLKNRKISTLKIQDCPLPMLMQAAGIGFL